MTHLSARLLAALERATPQAPMTLAQLAAGVDGPSADAGRIAAVLADLVARRAVGTARVGADPDRLQDVYWPTGALPARLPWRPFDASGLRADHRPPATPSEDPPMTRIRPTRNGDLILAHLAEHGPGTRADLRAALGIGNDVERYCHTQIARGELIVRDWPGDGPGNYHRKIYLLPSQLAAWEAAHPAPPAGPAPQTRRAAAPAPAEPAARPEPTAAPGRPAFALWDDGEITIQSGDDILRLDAQAVRRLLRLLRIADAALAGDAA